MPQQVRTMATSTTAKAFQFPYLTDSIRNSLPSLYDTVLQPIDLSVGSVVGSSTSTSLKQVVGSPDGTTITVTFVIRRPGWVLCREHGIQISELSAQVNAQDKQAVNFIGIIKETGVDDEGLMEFYQKYYTFPLFKDVDLKTYEAFGNRSIFKLRTWNPYRIWKGFKELGQRIKKKELEGNYAGEGLIQGGVLIFDRKGELQYAYEEKVGTELDMEEIGAALSGIMDEKQASSSSFQSSEL